MAIIKTLVNSQSGYDSMSGQQDERGETRQIVLLSDSWATWEADLAAAGYVRGVSTFPGKDLLKLRRIRFAGYGAPGTGSGNEYTHCVITLEYDANYGDLNGVPTWSFDSSQDVLTLGEDAYYASDGTAVDASVSRNKIIPYTDMTAEMPVIAYPLAAITAAQGCVNGYAWQPPGLARVFAPETVLFTGASSRPYYHPDYGSIYVMTASFRVAEYSHNAVERTGTYGSFYDYILPVTYQRTVFSGMGL